MNREQKLQQAKNLADKGLLEEAWNLVEEVTNENPKDGLAIMMGSYVMDLNKRYGLAYYLAREGVAFEPGRCHTWMQLGRACKAVWKLDE